MAEKAQKTSTFVWEGTDRKGAKIKGETAGQNIALVKAQLRKQGVNPTKVRKKAVSLFGAGKSIKPMDIALFKAAALPCLESCFTHCIAGNDSSTSMELSVEPSEITIM